MRYLDLPAPAHPPGPGHLGRWGGEPLKLLEEGAALAGPRRLFRLSLGLPTVVGFSPGWNRTVLTDPEGFVGRGSFSKAVPYLAGGIILTDAPGHRPRRAVLNVPFGKAAVAAMLERIQLALEPLRPSGDFDALEWADRAALAMLNAAYFSGEFPAELLHAFLAPLRHPFPTPMLPRPLLFLRVNAELRRLARRRLEEGGDDLLAHLARLPAGVEEARVSLAAGHDTTTHALAWAVWHLAGRPDWRREDGLKTVVKETLRLYPPGWMGSRRLTRDLDFEGVQLPRGAMVLYSSYLSARDPGLWERAHEFWPERWEHAPPPWAYLPFGGGARICLGMHLANSMIEAALALFLGGDLTPLAGDPSPRPSVTLGPLGPLWVRRG